MKEVQIRDVVLRVLGGIAPEADLAALDPGVSFRDQLDIDSMDFLNFVIGVCEELEIDVPEADYPKLPIIHPLRGYPAPGQTRAPDRLGKRYRPIDRRVESGYGSPSAVP
jgi:acyl carrier protein